MQQYKDIMPTRLIDLTPANKRFLDDLHRYIIVTAGRRSRKTLIADYKMLTDPGRGAFFNKGYKYIFAAPTNQQAKYIYWKKLKKDTKWAWGARPNETDLIIYLANGCELQVVGLDKPERIEGQTYPAIKGIHITEMPNAKPNVWDEHIQPILSDNEGFAIIDGVPEGAGDRYHELALYAAGGHFPNTVPMYGAYSENPQDPLFSWHTWYSSDVLPKHEIESAKRQLDTKTFRQEYEGSFITPSGLVYHAFGQHNYKYLEYEPNRKTVLCFDFNVDPMTCTINQEIEHDKWCFVKEFVIPNSHTAEMCEEIISFFDSKGKPIHLETTGDYAGTKKTTNQGGAVSDWTIIDQYLGMYPRYKRKIRPTVLIRNRTNAHNSRLKSMTGEVYQYINPETCKQSIKEYGILQYKENTNQIDDQNGRYGHLTDNQSYFSYNYYPVLPKTKTKVF